MPFIPAIIEIVDSNGQRVDVPFNGVQQPIRLKLGSNVSSSVTDANGITEVAINSAAGISIDDVNQAIAAGSRAWRTIADIDFAAQPDQTLSANQDYTIGGKTFTRYNVSEDGTAPWAVINGTGLKITGKNNRFGVNGFQKSIYNAPVLALKNHQLGTLSKNGFPAVRLSVIYGAVGYAVNGGGYGIGLYVNNGADSDSYPRTMGHTCFNGAVSYFIDTITSDDIGTNSSAKSTINPTWDTSIIELRNGLLGYPVVSYRGQSAGGEFPALEACQVLHCINHSITNVSSDLSTSLYSPDTWRPSIMCGLAHPDAYGIVKRFKVELFY